MYGYGMTRTDLVKNLRMVPWKKIDDYEMTVEKSQDVTGHCFAVSSQGGRKSLSVPSQWIKFGLIALWQFGILSTSGPDENHDRMLWQKPSFHWQKHDIHQRRARFLLFKAEFSLNEGGGGGGIFYKIQLVNFFHHLTLYFRDTWGRQLEMKREIRSHMVRT